MTIFQLDDKQIVATGFRTFSPVEQGNFEKTTNQKLAGDINSLDSNYKEVSSDNFLIASI